MTRDRSICWPDASCCWPGYLGGCICPPMERALRAWAEKRIVETMTAEQREACLDEIDRVEGYSRADYEAGDDALVAGGVLSAWADFCRDKGLMP